MSSRGMLLSACSLFLLSGCATQSSVPLPPNIEIVKPGPEVPAGQAAFVGKWEGTWDGRLEARLVVERILPGGKAEVIYGWGRFLDVFPDFRRAEASFDGTTLKFDTSAATKYQFTLRPDDKLEGRYRWNGGFSKGIFVRSADEGVSAAKR